MNLRRRIACPEAQDHATVRLQQGKAPGGTGFSRHFAQQQSRAADVRYGSFSTFRRLGTMSALPPKADMARTFGDVRNRD